jgi:hypothetical protein
VSVRWEVHRARQTAWHIRMTDRSSSGTVTAETLAPFGDTVSISRVPTSWFGLTNVKAKATIICFSVV